MVRALPDIVFGRSVSLDTTDVSIIKAYGDKWKESLNYTMITHFPRDDFPTFTLSGAECDEVIRHCDMRGWNVRWTLGAGSRDVHPSKELPPIVKIRELALEVNKHTYNYDLDEDNFECIVHKFQNGLGYHYHKDINAYRPYCKLAVSVMLSNPEDYDGGSLAFFEDGDPEHDHVVDKQRGTVAIFPAFCHHKVDLITRGTRYSLILFFYGPPFR